MTPALYCNRQELFNQDTTKFISLLPLCKCGRNNPTDPRHHGSSPQTDSFCLCKAQT